MRGTVVIPSTVTYIGSSAFQKQITWDKFNSQLTKIVNKTGREFDWKSITSGSQPATFDYGIAANHYGNIEITRS